MKLKLSDLKIKREYYNYLLLFLLIIIICFITYYRFKVQLNVGPAWDAYDFLANAAEFAGKGIGYSDQIRPPMLSFLTSLYFRFDGLNEGAIFAIDSILFVLGCIGLYFLLKICFNPTNSFIGTLIYAMSPIMISIISTGWSDISSVSFLILAVYFLIKGLNSNSKFLYLSFPFIIFAFLTRYSSALIIFPIFLYILIKKRNHKINQDIISGFLISVLITIPVLIFFYIKFGNPVYPFLDFMGTSAGSSLTQHFAYNPNQLFYLKNMPIYMGSVSITIFLIFLGGILGIFISKIKNYNKNTFSLSIIKNKNLYITILLFITFLLSWGHFSYLVIELVFFAFCYYLYQFLKIFDFENLELDFLFLGWVMVFFIFQSIYVIKVDRYFIAMIPPISYFLIRGLNLITDHWGIRIKNFNLTHYIFAVVLIVIIIVSSLSYISGITDEENYASETNNNIISASKWLKTYDPYYKNEIIYSDYWQYSAWYLQTNVRKMPIFINNQTLYSWSKNENFTKEDNLAYNYELDVNNAKYYFCGHSILNLTNYKPIKQFGNIILYERIN